MLLELLTGSPAADLKGRHLVTRLSPLLRSFKVDAASGQPVQDITPLVDPRMAGQWRGEHAGALLLLARSCVGNRRSARPTMQAVSDALTAIHSMIATLTQRDGASTV